MKTTYNLILAAFAAAVALSSCTKDIAADRQDTESDGLRTIEISFETPTKTVLNEDDIEKPRAVFKSGDKIMVVEVNGDEWEECTVTPSFLQKGAASFTTKLKGDLTVVYPSTAATVTGGRLDKVKIPANQTGRFADASIAVGTGGSAQGIMLSPIAAILRFYVGPSIGVDSLVIEAKENYLADGEFDETGKQLSDKPVKKIKIIPKGDDDVCYVAVRESQIGNNTLTVKSYTQTQKAENEDGLVIRRYCHVNLKSGMLADVFIPYYLEVPVGGDKVQRWGYCNVGAFRPEEAGEYFAWGSTEGDKWNSYSNSFINGYCFSWYYCPFNRSSEGYDPTDLNDKKDQICPDCTLLPEYDAAFAVWKGSWRMPRKDEIDSLYAHLESTWIGKKGLTIPTVDKRELFFPLTGYGYYDVNSGSYVDESKWRGMYWTSTLNETDMAKAYYFNFRYNDPDRDSEPSGFKLDGEDFERRSGMPIRPIFDLQEAQEVSFEILPKYTFGGNL